MADPKTTSARTSPVKQSPAKLTARTNSKEQHPELDLLFADGVLQQTLAVGYDESGYHLVALTHILKGLSQQGYAPVDVSTMDDFQLQATLGVDPKTIDRKGQYFLKHIQYDDKEVIAFVRLITPDTPDAKRRFAEAIASDEVVIYTGHGRHGSGPDFDDVKSAAGNFRIGDPYKQGVVALGDNDLVKTRFTPRYQMFVLDGCSTKHYVDDLRGKAQGKNTKNLDIIGTKVTLSWGDTASTALAALEGVSSNWSVNQLRKKLNEVNSDPAEKSADKFLFDGFEDSGPQKGLKRKPNV